jgi:hypothetical protein
LPLLHRFACSSERTKGNHFYPMFFPMHERATHGPPVCWDSLSGNPSMLGIRFPAMIIKYRSEGRQSNSAQKIFDFAKEVKISTKWENHRRAFDGRGRGRTAYHPW